MWYNVKLKKKNRMMQLNLYFFYQHYLSTVHGKKFMMRCDNIGIWLSVIEKLTRNTNMSVFL